MLRLAAASGLRVSQRGAALQLSRRCLVTKFSKVRQGLPPPACSPRALRAAAHAHSLAGAASAR